jgi:Ca2+-binding EF-hand superfamily protein
MIRRIFEWILDQRLSLAEAFKLMDADYDGVLTLSDLGKFLAKNFGVDPHSHRIKLERLFRILDLGKTGCIYLVDFENMFTHVYLQRGTSSNSRMSRTKSAIGGRSRSLAGFVIEWK